MFEAFDEGGGPGASHHKVLEQGRGAVCSTEGITGRMASPVVAGMAFRDVLRHVHLLENRGDVHAPIDLRRLNERPLCVLIACHQLDTARRRLMGSMNTQQTLKDAAHLLMARVHSGQSRLSEQLKLEAMLADLRRSVEDATEMWARAGRYFTRVTRLLPAQLDASEEGFVPVTPTEVDRLALEAQRAGDASLEDSEWYSPPVGGRFVQARETYLQAVMDWESAQAAWTSAGRARQQAEIGFRVGARGVLEFAQAVVSQDWQRGSFLSREAYACMKRHALYAAALQLPAHLGLR